MRRRPAAVACLLVGVALVGGAGPARADPAGPTDYRTEVTGIDPDVEGIAVGVIGGDSFVEVTVDPGIEVTVIGYQGEDYLRFDPDGAVYRNDRSPTRWRNEDRFGDGDVPSDATPEAAPLWTRVADGGRYAWHDHRSHWMNEVRPPAASPGDVILEAVIPLVVSGTPVRVAVRSTWVHGPDAVLPWTIAATIVAVAAIATTRFPRLRVAVAATGAAAALALGLGLTAFLSVPGETGPSSLLWLLPLASLGATVATLAAARLRVAPPATLAVAGLVLASWGWLRREALVRAIIPSDAPPTIDRVGIATALTLGAVVVVTAVAAAATPATTPAPPNRTP